MVRKITKEERRKHNTYLFKLKDPRLDRIFIKQCPRPLRFSRFTNTHDFMVEYFSDTGQLINSENRKLLNEKKYLVGDTEINYRTMNYWAKNKILPDGVINNGWKKFNLCELVWLKIVEKMREFGMDLNKIAESNYWIMQWDSKKDNYTWFEFYLSLALLSRLDPYVIVLPDGYAELATTGELESLKIGWDFNPNISKSILLISLKEILAKLGFKVKSVRLLEDLKGLDREIYEMIHFNLKKDSEVTIRLKKDGGVREIVRSKKFSNPTGSNDVDIHSDFFGDKIERYENGKLQSTEIKERHRL